MPQNTACVYEYLIGGAVTDMTFHWIRGIHSHGTMTQSHLVMRRSLQSKTTKTRSRPSRIHTLVGQDLAPKTLNRNKPFLNLKILCQNMDIFYQIASFRRPIRFSIDMIASNHSMLNINLIQVVLRIAYECMSCFKLFS